MNSYGDSHPYIVIQKQYWQDPIYVFTGLSWFVVGMMAGVVLMTILLA